ncbi:MAG: hypothetical protein OEO84_03170 [Betaproteobacteria bacterium]|nr:hypothetical protein [Betaproteobacteria bacterium]
MEPYLIWLLAGLALVIAALITTAMTVMDKTRQTQAAAKGG